jgi:hypothetical protein
MRHVVAVVVLLALGAPAALAQPTPALRDNAETRLNRALEQDRARDRVGPPGSFQPAPSGPESMRAMEDDRRSLGPDVGRPEAQGRMETGGERGALSGGMNPQR